ncbi:MAG: hypothetical protein WBO09_17450 [Methylocystis silviterrae]|uniref:hypothetical protein n=1 Tax=Methylocystis silviterrae TaxID=2743612 RepID=UPI003C77084B
MACRGASDREDSRGANRCAARADQRFERRCGAPLNILSLGGTASKARRQAIIWIGRQLQTQASHLAYIDVFYALTLVAATIIPLTWFLRRVRLGASNSAPAH